MIQTKRSKNDCINSQNDCISSLCQDILPKYCTIEILVKSESRIGFDLERQNWPYSLLSSVMVIKKNTAQVTSNI